MKTSFFNITDGKKWRLEEADYNEATDDFPERAYVSLTFEDVDDKENELCIMSSIPTGVIESLESMIKALEDALSKMKSIDEELLVDASFEEVLDNE